MAKSRAKRAPYSARELAEEKVLQAAGWKTWWQERRVEGGYVLRTEAPGEETLQAVEFTAKSYPVRFTLTRSARRPGWWQLTEFARDGAPWGHRDFKTAAKGVKEARRESQVSHVVTRDAQPSPKRINWENKSDAAQQCAFDRLGWRSWPEYNDLTETYFLEVEVPPEETIGAVEFVWDNGKLAFLLTRSAQVPGVWQLTSFANDGLPWGHSDWATLAEGVEEARRSAGRISQVLTRGAQPNPHVPAWLKKFDTGYADAPAYISDDERVVVENTRRVVVRTPDGGKRRVRMWMLSLDRKKIGEFQSIQDAVDALVEHGYMRETGLSEGKKRKRAKMKPRKKKGATAPAARSETRPRRAPPRRQVDPGAPAAPTHTAKGAPADEVARHVIAWVQEERRLEQVQRSKGLDPTKKSEVNRRLQRIYTGQGRFKDDLVAQYGQGAVDAGLVIATSVVGAWEKRCIKIFSQALAKSVPMSDEAQCSPEEVAMLLEFALSYRDRRDELAGKVPRSVIRERKQADATARSEKGTAAEKKREAKRKPRPPTMSELFEPYWTAGRRRIGGLKEGNVLTVEWVTEARGELVLTGKEQKWRFVRETPEARGQRGGFLFEKVAGQKYRAKYAQIELRKAGDSRYENTILLNYLDKNMHRLSGSYVIVKGVDRASSETAEPPTRKRKSVASAKPRLAKMKKKPPLRMGKPKTFEEEARRLDITIAKPLKWSRIMTGRKGTPNRGWTYIADAPGGQYDLDLSSSEQHPGGSGRKSYYVNFTPRGKKLGQLVVERGVSFWRTIPAAKSAAARHNRSRLEALPAANPSRARAHGARGRGRRSRLQDPEYGRKGMTVAKLLRRMGL